MITKVEYHESTFNEPPQCSEAGTLNVAGAAGLHAAIDYLDGIRAAIFEHDQRLAKRACEQLAEIDASGCSGQGRPLRSGELRPADAHALDLATMADQKELPCAPVITATSRPAARVPATARASFYYYNTEAEVDRFIEVIHQVRKLFA